MSLVLVGGDPSNSVISNQIGMKFGTNVL